MMRKTVLFLMILTLLFGINITVAESGDNSFDTTQLARTVQANIEVKTSPDPSAETLVVLEEENSIVVLTSETVLKDGSCWYRIFIPLSASDSYGYVMGNAIQKTTYDTLTDEDILRLYGDWPYLAVTRRANTKGYDLFDWLLDDGEIKTVIPHQGTLVYLYSVYPGYAAYGDYAGYDENWYYVMLADHETFAYVQGADLWILDKLPVHDESCFFSSLVPEESVKGNTWQDAYLSVLGKYQSELTDMEASEFYGNTEPIALWDVNGDGIKDLLFVIHGETGFELYDDNDGPLDLNLTELLVYSYSKGEAVNLLHLTAPSKWGDEDYERDEFVVRSSENGIFVDFSSSNADKNMLKEFGLTEDSAMDYGKYHYLYDPYQPGGGVITEAFPVTILAGRNEPGDEILCSTFIGDPDADSSALSLSEALEELRQ